MCMGYTFPPRMHVCMAVVERKGIIEPCTALRCLVADLGKCFPTEMRVRSVALSRARSQSLKGVDPLSCTELGSHIRKAIPDTDGSAKQRKGISGASRERARPGGQRS